MEWKGDEGNEPVPVWCCNPVSTRWNPHSLSHIQSRFEYTWALLKVYMYAGYTPHDGATLSYMEDAWRHFHTFKNVFFLGRAGKKVKAKANALRIELVKKRKVDNEKKRWNLDSIQGAARNEILAGSYQPCDTCFQGVTCRLQLSNDPLQVSLGHTDSSIRSLATVFCPESWTSTWNQPQRLLERLRSQSQMPATSNHLSVSHSQLRNQRAQSPMPRSVSGECRSYLRIPPFWCWSGSSPDLPVICEAQIDGTLKPPW